MNQNQAMIIMLRSAIAHLHVLHPSTLIPDWDFHTPENRLRLENAKDMVIDELGEFLTTVLTQEEAARQAWQPDPDEAPRPA